MLRMLPYSVTPIYFCDRVVLSPALLWLLITFLIPLTSPNWLAVLINNCYLTLAFCSTIRFPLVMLMIEL